MVGVSAVLPLQKGGREAENILVMGPSLYLPGGGGGGGTSLLYISIAYYYYMQKGGGWVGPDSM